MLLLTFLILDLRFSYMVLSMLKELEMLTSSQSLLLLHNSLIHLSSLKTNTLFLDLTLLRLGGLKLLLKMELEVTCGT